MRIPFENLNRDLQAAEKLLNKVNPELLGFKFCSVEFGRSLFFRNKAAYIIGQLHHHLNSWEHYPFAIALLNRKGCGSKTGALSGRISYRRRATQQAVWLSHDLILWWIPTNRFATWTTYARFLPNKERFELFNAIGFIKHAKTEFYRFKVDYTKCMPKETKYVSAPGIKGMVMLVFTTDDSDYVYKVIRDRFPPT